MRYSSMLALLVLSSFAMPAFAQDSMKMGDKNWVTLEKELDDVNNQWLCAGKYYKPRMQDCVNFRAQYWASSSDGPTTGTEAMTGRFDSTVML